jgi:hypothetical protein
MNHATRSLTISWGPAKWGADCSSFTANRGKLITFRLRGNATDEMLGAKARGEDWVNAVGRDRHVSRLRRWESRSLASARDDKDKSER